MVSFTSQNGDVSISELGLFGHVHYLVFFILTGKVATQFLLSLWYHPGPLVTIWTWQYEQR